jgi:hypothetical protein
MNKCFWKEDSNGTWWADCEEAFGFTNGSPRENNMNYCCYCGRILEQLPYIELVKPND